MELIKIKGSCERAMFPRTPKCGKSAQAEPAAADVNVENAVAAADVNAENVRLRERETPVQSLDKKS